MAASNNDAGDLCPDWIYSDSSNVHVAKDRAWFTSYHPFQSRLGSLYNVGTPFLVLGIGTVKLTVKALPGSFTPYGTSILELHNVLHVPSYSCNVLGRPLTNVYGVDLGGSVHEGGPPSRGGLFLKGRQVAHFQAGPISFFSLAVLPPAGKELIASSFKNGASWVVSCHWPNEERVRWQAVQDQAARDLEPPRYEPPYTGREIEYVNEHWSTEFRFLAQYGLKLHEEKDRSEGRRIVRALMKGKDPAEKEEKEVVVDGQLGDYLKPDGGKSVKYFRDPSAPRVPFL